MGLHGELFIADLPAHYCMRNGTLGNRDLCFFKSNPKYHLGLLFLYAQRSEAVKISSKIRVDLCVRI